MDKHIKIQIENIADLCNCSNKTIITPDRIIVGVRPNVSLQFDQLNTWRVVLVGYASWNPFSPPTKFDAVYFAKWKNNKPEIYLGMGESSSPVTALDEFYEWAKALIDDKFICVVSTDIKKM